MTKIQQNFEMWSKDHKNLVVTITGSDNAGYDLSSASWVKWILMEEPSSTACLISRNTGGSGVTVSTSTVTITLSPADTTSLAGTYYHELDIKDQYGNVSTATVGTVTINRSGQ